MVIYSLFGATGATGSAVLRCLLVDPPKDLRLNVLVRSKSKLLRAFPGLEETSEPVIQIIEGTSTDTAALHIGLQNADVAIVCVGSNESRPGMSLSYDTAAAIIDTLKIILDGQTRGYKTPTILQLRSASLSPTLSQQEPQLIRRFVKFCLHFAYADLQRASNLYESAAKERAGLLEYIFVDPPAIHDAEGTDRTGHELVTEKQTAIISYADLGAGFCELAERRAEFLGRSVGVSAKGKPKETWGTLIGYLLSGAAYRVLDWMGL